MNTAEISQAKTKTTQATALGFLRVVTLVAMAGAAIWFVGSLATAITSDSLVSPLELTPNASSITSPYPDSATITDVVALVDVKVGLGLRLAWWLVTDALAIVGVGFLYLLWRMLGTAPDLFVEENATRLRLMSVCVFVLAIAEILQGPVAFGIQDSAGFEGMEATFSFAPIAGLIVLAALLEVWSQGIRLRTDAELTI